MPLLACAVLAACASLGPPVEMLPEPSFDGVELRLIGGDLVGFVATMRGIDGPELVEAYARCAAAGFAVAGGYGFARHVRTLVEDGAGIWRADAVYTFSPALPEGLRTIDAEVTVADCGLRGIPTV